MPAGRPRMFETPEALQKKVDEYFLNPPNKRTITTSTGTTTKVEQVPIYAICGLAYFLGFLDRQSLYDYEKRNDEYSCIIKKAHFFIESEYEVALRDNNVAGVIFALKNMGWTDKREVDHKNLPGVKLIFQNIKIEGKTAEDLSKDINNRLSLQIEK
jgi:hypothetical protein